MRVALDTNVLVSAIATRGLCADLLGAILAEHRLIVGATVLDELKRVLEETIRIPSELRSEVESLVRREAIIAGPAEPLRIKIRDKSDLPVLAEAIAAGAEVLVTGDNDLLEIAVAVPIRILSPRGFWEMLREEPAAYRVAMA